MKETFNNVITYIKNPVPGADTNKDYGYRIKIFFHLFIISIATSIIITPLFSLIQELQLVDFETHKIEEMFKDMSFIQVLLLSSVVAPIIEETLFRAPITIFIKPNSFKYAFYIFTLIFGFIHISNFKITTNVLLLSPLLILPQLLVGGYFGYIRVKFGLLWSILLHGSYNGFLFLMSFLFE
ncbi:CPBP family intramembrane glutamic endopeptidase [Polaribacter sp. Q13]|uniref:CPBP family intramembrane glutamic endopeptidase n=1 Tax=Polaribacter sp. Q13 TaxID=2806551 RepID=UPI00193BD109|nr:CPBP family intramembrane glutamic endopeptidase [Polaribacter sp. Q13]QVY66969.1 CPBP family intramembrane metalloprotease [Polaribacter sp. Q13]